MKKIGIITLLFLGLSLSAFAPKNETAKPIHLTKKDFLVKIFNYEKNPDTWNYLGERPAVIDFYATWCGPCRAIAPTLDELAQLYDGKVDIYKIDVDKEPELAAAFGVQSIPTLLFIPMKGTPHLANGALSKDSFRKVIDEVLLKEK